MADADVEEFCQRVWPRLAASLGFVSGDPGIGEEIAQEALVRVWAKWEYVSGLESPEAWVYRVAINLSHSRFRRLRAERKAMTRVGSSAPAPMSDRADAIAVRDAVKALPERQRSALVLRYFADLPVADVAEILGCAQGTVKSLTSKAIDRLRQEFTVNDMEEACI